LQTFVVKVAVEKLVFCISRHCKKNCDIC